MFTIALASAKGGSGKTTTAINLSVAGLLQRRRTIILDLDPQASARAWADQRSNALPAVIKAKAERLRSLIKQAADEGAQLCVLDVPPHVSAVAAAAMDVADLTLVPCQPSFFDLSAIGSSLAIARTGNSRAAVLLNRCPVQGGQVAAALDALDGVAVAPVQFHQRVAYARAASRGQGVQEFEPDGQAAAEVAALYSWIFQKGSA